MADLSTSQVRTALNENIGVLDTADHIGRDLMAMQLADNAAAGPEKPRVPVKLQPATGSFLFRTKGIRQTSIALRVYQPNPRYDDDQNRKYKNNWERNAKNVWGDDWKKALKPDLDLFNKHGIERINFRPIPGVAEATYTTRDPEIAAYIRLRIQEPGLGAIIYEEVGPTWATLDDGTRVQVLPATDESRQTMAAVAAGA